MALAGYNFDVIEGAAQLPESPGTGAIFAVVLPMSRGEATKTYLCSSQSDLKQVGGALLDDVDEHAYAHLFLKSNGARLLVTRAVDYTDVDDPDTVIGTKASATITDGGSNSVTFTATGVGPAYADEIEILAPLSEAAGVVDIKLTTTDTGEEPIYARDVPSSPSATDKAAVKAKLRFYEISAQAGDLTALIAEAAATASGGVYDPTTITAAAYVGSTIGKTGVYSFDDSPRNTQIDGMACYKHDLTVLNGHVQYAQANQRYHVFSSNPVGLTAQGAVDYALAQGAFASGPDINSKYCYFALGNYNAQDPRTTQAVEIKVPGTLVAMAAFTAKNLAGNTFEGFIQNPFHNATANGLDVNSIALDPYNSSNKDVYTTAVATKGLNYIYEHPQFGVVIAGNWTMSKALADKNSKYNVWHWVLQVERILGPALHTATYGKFNTPDTWRAAAQEAELAIETNFVATGAILPRKNQDWYWVGDQSAATVQDAVYNLVPELEQGQYKVAFVAIASPLIDSVRLSIISTTTGNIDRIVEPLVN